MASCLRAEEYAKRTYTKQIGEFSLACDRIYYMGDETEISPEEEAEALTLLAEAIVHFKKYSFPHTLLKASPIKIKVRSGKLILFTVSDAYWGAWIEEDARIENEEYDSEMEEKAQKEAEKLAEKTPLEKSEE